MSLLEEETLLQRHKYKTMTIYEWQKRLKAQLSAWLYNAIDKETRLLLWHTMF